MGWGAWAISNGRFGDVSLDGARFDLFYKFPGRVEEGHGTACAYVDSRATPAQQQALEQIGMGKAGGGIFALFGADLVTTWLPAKRAAIEFELNDGRGRVDIGIARTEPIEMKLHRHSPCICALALSPN